MSSVKLVLGIVVALDLELEKRDVNASFLHGGLEEEMYMERPKGFIQKDREKSIYRLKKGLCGTKQAPRQWYKKFDSFMHGRGSKSLNVDRCIHIKIDNKKKWKFHCLIIIYR
jgi:hypothetical protein